MPKLYPHSQDSANLFFDTTHFSSLTDAVLLPCSTFYGKGEDDDGDHVDDNKRKRAQQPQYSLKPRLTRLPSILDKTVQEEHFISIAESPSFDTSATLQVSNRQFRLRLPERDESSFSPSSADDMSSMGGLGLFLNDDSMRDEPVQFCSSNDSSAANSINSLTNGPIRPTPRRHPSLPPLDTSESPFL